MKKLFLLLVLTTYASASTYVAVLETVSDKKILGRQEKMFLTDKLRERAKVVLPSYMGYVIMTRENIQQMLPPGKTIEECEGSCIVETGKRIAADYVAQARVGSFGKKLTLTVELYETSGNNLMGSYTAVKKNADGLLEEIANKSDDFFKLILNEKIVSEKKEVEKYNDELLIDERDGEKYKVVKIGPQIWMAENLRYKAKGSYCYKNNQSMCDGYGRLYTWISAMNLSRKYESKKASFVTNGFHQGVCPSGWHIPTNKEWVKLADLAYYSFSNDGIGTSLKDKNGWQLDVNVLPGKDNLGFSALPAGAKSDEDFFGAGEITYFITASESDDANIFTWGLKSSRDTDRWKSSEIASGTGDKKMARSLRCLKNLK